MIHRVAFRRYSRPFIQALRTARGEWAVREGFILRVESSNGLGFAEVAPIPEFGSESLEQAERFLNKLTADPECVPDANLPCCAFALSAAQSAALLPEQGVALSALLPAGEAALDSLRTKRASGFTNFKWKVGVESPEVEQALFEKLCEQLPPDARIRLDANASWSVATLQSWVDHLSAFSEQLDYLEQPLAVGQEIEMARVMDASGLPIALDESLQGDGVRWLEPGAWDGPLVIKPALMGDANRLHARIEPLASHLVLSSVFETAVGVANVLTLAASLPDLGRPLGFDTAGAFDDHLSLPTAGAWLSLSDYNAELLWETLRPHLN